MSTIIVDLAGNLYIADQSNNVVRKVTPDGTITTVAGNGTSSDSGDGGQATDAGVYYPYGLAIDLAGNLYISDNGHRIRMVTPDGIIRTTAGNGNGSYTGDGGQATDASLNYPAGLAVDALGNLYIADQGNDVIREITPDGIIRTIAGFTAGYAGDGGPATNATLTRPAGVAIDAHGNLFIADQGNHVIREITPDGIMHTVAGFTAGYSGDGGPATFAQLNSPTSIAVDALGNLYIADDGNNVIREITPDGIIHNLAGLGTYGFAGDGGPAGLATLGDANSVALDTFGNLYLADSGNEFIREIMGGSAVQINAFGAAASFTLTGVTTGTAGGLQTVTVTAYDAFGNVVTDYSGTVHFTSTDGQAELPADATLTNGVGTFQVTLKTAGSQSITVTDTTTPGLTGTEMGLLINPSFASQFSVSGLVDAPAGTVGTVTITALDAYGNVATGFTHAVHFTSDDPIASLPADATLTNGVGMFPVTLKTVGVRSITASDALNSDLFGTESNLLVTPGAAASFTVTGGGERGRRGRRARHRHRL